MELRPGLVSIMMPAYNAGPYIGQAIESVLAQSYADWELIVVDDGSSDDTAAVAAGYADPRIWLISQPNGGESAARNTALPHMKGEFVAFLDADDAYLPDHLQVTAGYLQSRPDCGGVYTDGYHIDSDGNRLAPLSSRRRGPFEGDIFEQMVRASDVFGPPLCVVLRHHLVAKCGLRFDESIVIGPDWDFLTRYSELARFGYVNAHTCLYRVHQTNVTLRVDRQRRALYMARCREKAIKLNSFGACSLETRWQVFYDLLINLLAGQPERQAAVVNWLEFSAIPLDRQARLLRLMAGRALVAGVEPAYVRSWLQAAHQLNPADRRGALLLRLYSISPALCRLALRARTLVSPPVAAGQPFGDLLPDRSH